MSLQNSHQISDVKVMLKVGADGAGISTIEKTGTSGLVDTYTITLTDGRKYTFTVTNGKAISSVAKTSTSGLTDTYTITYNDGTTDTFAVTNGKGIVKIEKTGTVGLIDTYTVTYNDGTTWTYEVTNGAGATASGVTYDNTSSGLTASNVQDAIDEVLALADTWTSAVNCIIGDTTATFTDANIRTTSIIEDFCENSSGTKIAVSQITVTNGQAVLNFSALSEATSFKLHIINR